MSNETQQEQWNATHAQLLKSVADAQSKLLAGINEITDKLDKLSEYSTHNLEVAEKRINGRLDDLKVLIAQTQEAVRNSHGSLSGRLNDLEPHIPAPRACQSRITKPPQRKQRR